MNRIAAVSPAVGAVISCVRARPRRSTSRSVCPPHPKRRPTVTSARTVRNGPGKSRRAACARGTPMNASARTSSRQRRRAARAIPGSMRTRTAPALNRPKTSGKNSRLGGAIMTVRTARPMPIASRPEAYASLLASSSPNVSVSQPPCPPEVAGAMMAGRSGASCAIRGRYEAMLAVSAGEDPVTANPGEAGAARGSHRRAGGCARARPRGRSAPRRRTRAPRRAGASASTRRGTRRRRRSPAGPSR